MAIYVLAFSAIQLLLVAYWWRTRVRRLPFLAWGSAVMAVIWSAALFIPFEHSVVIAMPPGGTTAAADGVARTISVVLAVGLVIVINQLILLGVRACLNRQRA